MRIVALRTFDADTQVYDLTIEQHHCYIANGVLSSNSHFGDGFTYGAQVMSERLPELKEEKKPLRGQVIVMPNGGFSFAKSLEEMWAETPKASARI